MGFDWGSTDKIESCQVEELEIKIKFLEEKLNLKAKANSEVLPIFGAMVRTLSRLDNKNPELLLEVDKTRLLKGKETISELSEINPLDILKRS